MSPKPIVYRYKGAHLEYRKGEIRFFSKDIANISDSIFLAYERDGKCPPETLYTVWAHTTDGMEVLCKTDISEYEANALIEELERQYL